MTKFAIAFLFALLTLAPLLIAQAEESRAGQNGADNNRADPSRARLPRAGPWRADLRRARARLNARAGRLGWPLTRLLHRNNTP
jgi:hypothetical protein